MDDNKKFKNILAYWTVKDVNKKPKSNVENTRKSINKPNEQQTKPDTSLNNNKVDISTTNTPTTTTTTTTTSEPEIQQVSSQIYSAFSSANSMSGYDQNNNNNNNEEDSLSVFAKSYSSSDAYSILDSEFENISTTSGYGSETSYISFDSGYESDNNTRFPPSSSMSSFYSIVSSGTALQPMTGSSSTISQQDNYSVSGSSSSSSYAKETSSYDDLSENENNKKSESDDKIKSRKEKQRLKENRFKKSNGRDWNQEFQELLRLQPGLDKFQKLSYLALDFVKAAENYGFIIIKEMFMPDEMKTIKPTALGGIAGGQKFRCQNILFKFAYDQEVAPNHYLYGGKYPNDLGASKAAGNELKGLSCFFQHLLDNELGNIINVPLMCIIDYYGYRLIAMSVLPISKKTLVYGSSDGGNHVHKDIDEVNNYMEILGKSMNLKGHLSGVKPEFVYGPGDLEVHKSLIDSRYYCIDYGRLFAPEAHFDKQDKSKAVPHRDVFYKLLRPELLKQINRSLSSDAFTGWSHSDPDCEVLNKEVGDATKELFSIVIPNAVKQFEDDFKRLKDYPEFKKSWDISVECHKFGINLRHLGRVRELAENSELRMIILNEMVSRIFKNKIKESQRINLTGHFVGSEEKCIQSIVNFINRIFNVDRYETDKDFWTIIIKTLCLDKYGNESCGLSKKELDSKYDLLQSVNISLIMNKFQLKTGIKLDSRIKKILADPNRARLPFILPSDIKDVRPVVKHSNMIARSEGISLYMKATELIYRNHVSFGKTVEKPDYNRFKEDFSEELSLLELCSQKLRMASRSSTTDSSLYHLMGLVELERYKISSTSLTHGSPIIQSAKEMFQTSIKYFETSGNLLSLATIYDIQGNHKESMKIYQERLLKNFSVDIAVPLLYESASFYATVYCSVTNANYLSVAFHQCLLILETLKALPSQHVLVQEYLSNTFYILSIMLIRTLSSGDYSYLSRLMEIYTLKNDTKHTVQDSEMIFSKYIEEALCFKNNLLNSFIDYAFRIDKNLIHAISLITCCKFSPSLTKDIKSYLLKNPNSLSKQDIFNTLLSRSNSTLQNVIGHLNIPLECFTLFNLDLDITTQQHIKYLYLRDCVFKDSFIIQSKIFAPKILYLSLNGCSFSYKEISKHHLRTFQLPNLRILKLSNITAPIELIESLLISSKNSLEALSMQYLYFLEKPKEEEEIEEKVKEEETTGNTDNSNPYEAYYAQQQESNPYEAYYSQQQQLEENNNNSEETQIEEVKQEPSEEELYLKSFSEDEVKFNKILLGMVTLKKIHLASHRCISKYLPESLESLKIGTDPNYSDFLKTIVERCKNFKSFKTNIKCNYSYLKEVSLKSLDIYVYHNYLDDNKFSEGIKDTWGQSLENLRLFHQNEFKGFSDFIGQLKNLISLNLSYKCLDDPFMETIIKNLDKLVTLKISSPIYKLLPSSVISNSIEILELGHIGATTENYLNLGLIFPKLKELAFDYPRTFSDVSFINVVENLNLGITKLQFRNCFDLTDTSLIYLSQSRISPEIERVIICDSGRIGDGAYVKLIDCLGKLKFLRPSRPFQRSLTFAYIRSKYPELQLSFRD